MQTHHSPRRFNKRRFIWMLTLLALLTLAQSISAQTEPESQILILPEEQIIIQPLPTPTPITESCVRIVTAKVVAFNQPITFNRLGAVNPVGMMFALERDIVAIDSTKGLVAANVRVRPDKRPRPITLRMNVGDCLVINLTNYLAADPADVNSYAAGNAPASSVSGNPPVSWWRSMIVPGWPSRR